MEGAWRRAHRLPYRASGFKELAEESPQEDETLAVPVSPAPEPFAVPPLPPAPEPSPSPAKRTTRARRRAPPPPPPPVEHTPERIEALLRELGVMSCEEVQAARREELTRLNVDSTAALQTCNQEFRATIEKIVQDTKGMSEEDVRLVLKQSRRELEGSTATLQQRIEAIIGDVREQEDDASWREWFKKTSKAAAAGLVTGAVAGASTYLAGGGDAATAAASLSAAGLVAYCAYYNINPVSWLMDKVRRAWQDPAWASICIQKFVAVKRIACEVVNRVLLHLAAFAIGKTGGADRDEYVELRMGDIDRVAGGMMCGMLLSIGRTALADQNVVGSVVSSTGDVLKKAVPAAIAAYTGGTTAAVLGAVSKVFESSAAALPDSKLLSGAFEVVFFERALRNSLAHLVEIFDPRCATGMLANLATIHAAVCRHFDLERTAAEDAVRPAPPPDDRSLIERMWSILTAAARCPAPPSFPMTRLTIKGTEARVLKFLDEVPDDLMRAAVVEHLYVTKPEKKQRGPKAAKLLARLERTNETTRNNDPAVHFVLRVPPIDDAMVAHTLEEGVELDLLLPPAFAVDAFRAFEAASLTIQENVRRAGRSPLLLATPAYDALCRDLGYRRLATLYMLNQRLWTSRVWDGTYATEAAAMDPASRAGKSWYSTWAFAYLSDTLAVSSQSMKRWIQEKFVDRKLSITGGFSLVEGVSAADMTAIAAQLHERAAFFQKVEDSCLHASTIDINRYFALKEFRRAIELFVDEERVGPVVQVPGVRQSLLQRVLDQVENDVELTDEEEEEGEEQDEL